MPYSLLTREQLDCEVKWMAAIFLDQLAGRFDFTREQRDIILRRMASDIRNRMLRDFES